MSNDLLEIPVPDGKGGEPPDAWKKAMEELNKVKPKNDNGHGGNSTNNRTPAGQNGVFHSWMNPQPYQTPFPTGNQYGGFGGGWHPSTWNQNPVPPPPPPSGSGPANYQNQPYNYQNQSYNYQNQTIGGRGRGRGRGAKNNWQPNPHPQQQQQQQQQKFQGFQMKNGVGGNGYVQSPQGRQQMGRGIGFGTPQGPPPSARNYMERSFNAATTPEERQKVQDYLKKRLDPMISAGTAHTVDWDREPLPHERNYELPAMWTPANKLGYQANGTHAKPKQTPNRQQEAASRRRSGGEDAAESTPDYKRTKRDGSSSPDSDIIELMHVQKNGKNRKNKKSKQEKKNKPEKNQFRFEYSDTEYRREERARRFAETLSAVKPSTAATQHHIRRGQLVKGVCTDIEKSYFRLTAAPDPNLVRPLHILEKSLDNVKNKYRARAEYRYLSSQLRSIRQDLTVQGIRNEFTVQVYEINARISLENKDREEFNQCQSQLKLLYSDVENCIHRAEFLAYRLLYYIAMDDLIDINSILKEVTPELKKDECVDFALKVRKAVSLGNYIAFFKLFQNAPKMCPYIMDMFVDRERKKALNFMTKAFRQTLSYKDIASFMEMTEEDLVDWLVAEIGMTEAEVGGSIDCRVPRNF
ncbi:unnamed protein product [Caenorhabditis bovis]|uniref:PCI domain-containing protein n=1 Tax=Caenorhabditis bovis TaxID=2654633 RepID=A0A8S1ERB0_9PELO|nr:unnamed protein product [Caenorhabditis bovis]